jgi:hypothetical protein
MPVDPDNVTSLQAGDVNVVTPIVTVLAKSYTRGRGFLDGEPAEDIAAAIATASARLAANGAQIRRKRVDDVEYEWSLRSSFEWSLAERIVLDRYRVKAM